MFFFGDLSNRYVQAALLLTAGLTAIGAVDDLVKLRGSANGISARCKLAGQLAVATVVAVLIYQHHAALPDGLQLRLPLLSAGIPLGVWFIPAAVIVIVGSSNAVNLTDGLDGLAGGCLIFAVGAMTMVCYASGHAELAEYLNIPRIPGAGELTVLGGATIGGVLGFLWFNCHPAQVFMGDTGALPLGGLLGLLAVAARQELLLLVVGGVFVVEALSVILQVGSYRWRRRRIFLCAPLHHHFQLKGWAENKIVVRFWIAAALCALLGAAGLKLSVDRVRPGALQDRRGCDCERVEITVLPFADENQPHPSRVYRRRNGRASGSRAGRGRAGHRANARRKGHVCRQRQPLERRLVAGAGFEHVVLPCRPMPRRLRDVLPFLADNVAGYRAAGRFIEKENVAVVVGLGGYASVPMARAAVAGGLPLILMEQNVAAGTATRWLSRRASLLCAAFEQTAEEGRLKCPIQVTGNPVRKIGTVTYCSSPNLRFAHPWRQRRGTGAQRKRPACARSSSTTAQWLDDSAPVGRVAVRGDRRALSPTRSAGLGRAVHNRRAGRIGRNRPGHFPRRRHDAGRVGRRRCALPCCCLIRTPPPTINSATPGFSRPPAVQSCSTSASYPDRCTIVWPVRSGSCSATGSVAPRCPVPCTR